MSLFLYLLAFLAHPQGCLKGTIYSLISRYFTQNTYRKDYIFFVEKLYHNLPNRAWNRAYLRSEFKKACLAIEAKGTQQQQPTNPEDKKNALILHLEFHPKDIKKQMLRELYQEHCGGLSEEELGIKRPIIAYSRPKNLGDYITLAKLHQAYSKTASTITGEFKQGLSL